MDRRAPDRCRPESPSQAWTCLRAWLRAHWDHSGDVYGAVMLAVALMLALSLDCLIRGCG